MTDSDQNPAADHVFDGGAMDCGSGLILLIRQNMLQVPVGGILVIHSKEPTVETELPPWCRMVGHEHVRSVQIEPGVWQHFVRRGDDTHSESSDLESEKQKAKQFKWSVRARRTSETETTTYSRNFSWKSNSSIDFDRKGKFPSSLEQLFGAVISDLINCFAIRCSKNQIILDELEGTLNSTLNNSLAAVGIEQGDSSVREIKIVIYASSPALEDDVRDEWKSALAEAPVFQTIKKSCPIEPKLVLR